MAGTRLAAHTCFLVFALISVLVAWRLGVVKRAPLPLNTMSQPFPAPHTPGELDQPVPLPVDIDLVILRSPSDGDCPSCAALLDAMQTNPSLTRNAFREAEAAATTQAASSDATEDKPEQIQNNENDDDDVKDRENIPPLFAIRDVNVRVVHADHGVAAAAAAPSASRTPAALDEWLHHSFILPFQNRQRQPSDAFEASDTATADSPAIPRYTFFVGCAGGGDAGEIPTFTMGKSRHGYLGIGCACSCGEESSAAGEDGSGGALDAERKHEGEATTLFSADDATGGTKDAAIAASTVLQTLAEVVVTNVLRSPDPAGDVHVRLGHSYSLNFSLLTENPAERMCTWDFAAISKKFLKPMLNKLSPIATFAVQSQEVHYARLATAPPVIVGAGRWYYSPRDLQGFLGANDFSTLDLAAGWDSNGETADTSASTSMSGDDGVGDHAAPGVSTPHGQVPVNFMVFCPSPKTSPLVFMEEWKGAGGRSRPFAEAYEVPGFGGVSVVNRGTALGDSGDTTAADSILDVLLPDRTRRAFGAHASQLRRIIGLPRPSDRPSEVHWPWNPREGSEEEEGPIKDGNSSRGSLGSLCGSRCMPTPGETHPKRQVLPLTFLPSPTDGVTDWEVDALLRAGLARNRGTAVETLRSLAALVESQPEMEVSTKVADDVAAALAALVETDAAVMRAAVSGGATSGKVREGGTLAMRDQEGAQKQWDVAGHRQARSERTENSSVGERGDKCGPGRENGTYSGKSDGWACAGAMRWAREALRRSEAAYFDPTMVPQLYFPQDHLMAVYLPFLGPLAFPLLVGFAQELWRYYKKRKAKSDKAKRDAQESGTREGSSEDTRAVANVER